MTAPRSVEQDLEAVLAAAKMHRRASYILAAIVLGLVILFLFMFCRAQPNVIPAKDQQALDVQHGTQKGYDSTRKENVKAEGASVLRSSTHVRQATTSLHAADSLHVIALALQKLAEAQRDTSSRWYGVAMITQKENDSLRASNRGLDSALQQQKIATAFADQRARTDSIRLVASSQLNDRLANDVKTAGQCRFGHGLFQCPTRTETAVTVTITTLIAKAIIDSRRKP
ncbi:MAG TPA: hypothetical protein VGQ44_17345 [Gemmatimonadaceae bacterium]|jgi:multidrug efflux pump subunit AcrB|nr:hypothetical protein [Gemmatimonadaceae bacterium]